jgi:hypothetical protein
MAISDLFIYSKNTDVTESIRGYKCHDLKTLETWLGNKLNGIEENIYCDYEEDIFQRDLSLQKVKFRQLKLYLSKNFSFSSEEVIKGLSHFFMFFVNLTYQKDKPIFVFETNISIARKYGNNDAELLVEWQDSVAFDYFLNSGNYLFVYIHIYRVLSSIKLFIDQQISKI